MSLESLQAEQRLDNQEILEALQNDGADFSEDFVVEHHFAAKEFSRLEKVAVEAFKLGFEVSDAEEFKEGRNLVYCFDAIKEEPLVLDKLNADTDALLALAEKFGVEYDGWGTYFGDDILADELDEDDEDDERLH